MNTSNRDLLELAAKAAGINGKYCNLDGFESIWWNSEDDCVIDWNPLMDDTDALRLAVDLKIGVSMDELEVFAVPSNASAESVLQYGRSERLGGDPYVALRRVIVRTAAAMGDRA